jgi:hypothetical protein
MMFVPPPQLAQNSIELERRIKQQEIARNFQLSLLDAPVKQGLSRRAAVFIRLMVIVLVIVAAVVAYRLIF